MKNPELPPAAYSGFPPRKVPSLREFSRRFKRKYGRLMTQDERRFFHLLADLIDNPPPSAGQRNPKLTD